MNRQTNLVSDDTLARVSTMYCSHVFGLVPHVFVNVLDALIIIIGHD